jgi:exopolyphosphatase/guanosine-5'-triphosphate,3'-diphosphate pyrophosphatase
MTRIAIIDMGTNTFHLLLAEVSARGYRIVRRDHEAIKIGMAGINEGFISESACARALDAMCRFKETIGRHQAAAVQAFGTSAFRNAANGAALAAAITARTGIPVRIISGEEEADYIFEGIKAAMDLGCCKNLVIDIGAGSVEFIIGDRENVFWKQSFEIGGQRLLEMFHKHDPIRPEEIVALKSYFEKSLTALMEALQHFKPTVLIGSSGTFDTLSAIYCHRRGITHAFDDAETPLSVEGFFDIYTELINKNRDQRMHMKGMIALRVDLIVVGCCLIRFILGKHVFERIRVSTYSLKEGVLAKVVSNHHNDENLLHFIPPAQT